MGGGAAHERAAAHHLPELQGRERQSARSPVEPGSFCAAAAGTPTATDRRSRRAPRRRRPPRASRSTERGSGRRPTRPPADRNEIGAAHKTESAPAKSDKATHGFLSRATCYDVGTWLTESTMSSTCGKRSPSSIARCSRSSRSAHASVARSTSCRKVRTSRRTSASASGSRSSRRPRAAICRWRIVRAVFRPSPRLGAGPGRSGAGGLSRTRRQLLPRHGQELLRCRWRLRRVPDRRGGPRRGGTGPGGLRRVSLRVVHRRAGRVQHGHARGDRFGAGGRAHRARPRTIR